MKWRRKISWDQLGIIILFWLLILHWISEVCIRVESRLPGMISPNTNIRSPHMDPPMLKFSSLMHGRMVCFTPLQLPRVLQLLSIVQAAARCIIKQWKGTDGGLCWCAWNVLIYMAMHTFVAISFTLDSSRQWFISLAILHLRYIYI